MSRKEPDGEVLRKAPEKEIRKGIAECDRYIAKEEPRAADTRPMWATQHLAFCYLHRARLQTELLRRANEN